MVEQPGRLDAAFAIARGLEADYQLGALLSLDRLPPSHSTGEHRCLGHWAWRARFCRILPSWAVVEVIDEDPATAIATAAARLREIMGG